MPLRIPIARLEASLRYNHIWEAELGFSTYAQQLPAAQTQVSPGALQARDPADLASSSRARWPDHTRRVSPGGESSVGEVAEEDLPG
ncbi:hypothetical protein MUG91_G912n3 [Manis pentadactyla]|nr:hypothetical protein MUG91_G912n3 [Manis pentadactyla]